MGVPHLVGLDVGELDVHAEEKGRDGLVHGIGEGDSLLREHPLLLGWEPRTRQTNGD